MKILLLTRFGELGASSRLRLLQYLPRLASCSIDYVVSPLFDDVMLLGKYQYGRYGVWGLISAYWRRFYVLMRRERYDLVWIEKEVLPWLPACVEKWMLRGVPYVLDFDDAIFHNYDRHRYAIVRCIYGRRIDQLMAGAWMVIAGNGYLANRAIAAGARRVEIVPTVVDLSRYTIQGVGARRLGETMLRVVWIGSPSTVQYLLELRQPLVELAKRWQFTLRVIGGGSVDIPGVIIESLPWSMDTEVDLIAECDVGIMPLRDTPWEQGKCAYKLIQYMACGIPTVASPVGANRKVIIERETGFFADTPAAWVDSLEILFRDVALRQRLGRAGRGRVEREFSLQQSAPRMLALLAEAEVE